MISAKYVYIVERRTESECTNNTLPFDEPSIETDTDYSILGIFEDEESACKYLEDVSDSVTVNDEPNVGSYKSFGKNKYDNYRKYIYKNDEEYIEDYYTVNKYPVGIGILMVPIKNTNTNKEKDHDTSTTQRKEDE